MKVLSAIILLFVCESVWSYACPNTVDVKKGSVAAHQFLLQFQGQYRLGACQVEITTCDKTLEPESGNPVGEVFLVDQYDREIYLSLEYPEKESHLLRTRTQHNKRMLNYKKRDRHYEDELGRTEHYQLEMLTQWDDTQSLKSIHVGVYSTNNQLNQPNGNDSTWSVCVGDE